MSQQDLFGPAIPAIPAAAPPLGDDVLAFVRAAMEQRLHRLRTAELIPWEDAELIRLENYVRYNRDKLPPDETAAAWAEADRRLDRLYAALNEKARAADQAPSGTAMQNALSLLPSRSRKYPA